MSITSLWLGSKVNLTVPNLSARFLRRSTSTSVPALVIFPPPCWYFKEFAMLSIKQKNLFSQHLSKLGCPGCLLGIIWLETAKALCSGLYLFLRITSCTAIFRNKIFIIQKTTTTAYTPQRHLWLDLIWPQFPLLSACSLSPFHSLQTCSNCNRKSMSFEV